MDGASRKVPVAANCHRARQEWCLTELLPCRTIPKSLYGRQSTMKIGTTNCGIIRYTVQIHRWLKRRGMDKLMITIQTGWIYRKQAFQQGPRCTRRTSSRQCTHHPVWSQIDSRRDKSTLWIQSRRIYLCSCWSTYGTWYSRNLYKWRLKSHFIPPEKYVWRQHEPALGHYTSRTSPWRKGSFVWGRRSVMDA